jgi:hypothetical protein
MDNAQNNILINKTEEVEIFISIFSSRFNWRASISNTVNKFRLIILKVTAAYPIQSEKT